jgi:hypothetical protein
MLKNFLQELVDIQVPGSPQIALYVAGFDAFVDIEPARPMELFYQAVTPHVDKIMEKNPAFFDADVNLPGGLDLKSIWGSPKVSNKSREAIWQYLHTLYMLSSVAMNMPSNMLRSIEEVAEQCATGIKDGEISDMQAVASMLMSKGLGMGGGAGEGSGGAGLLASLLPGVDDGEGKKKK